MTNLRKLPHGNVVRRIQFANPTTEKNWEAWMETYGENKLYAMADRFVNKVRELRNHPHHAEFPYAQANYPYIKEQNFYYYDDWGKLWKVALKMPSLWDSEMQLVYKKWQAVKK